MACPYLSKFWITGIFLAEQIFGVTITRASDGEVPTRTILEKHVLEDLGRIPTLEPWV
jgi:hypothetical protein